MLRFLLVFTIFSLTCDSKTGVSENGYKINNDHSLLNYIQRSPQALAEMFQGTDVKAVQNIIIVLKNLISSGKVEISAIEQQVVTAKVFFKDAKNKFDNAKLNESLAKNRMDDAFDKFKKAEGALTLLVADHKAAVPELKDEIKLLHQVIDVLKKLMGKKNPGEKDTAMIRAFISEADQADPDKLQIVINLVLKLIDSASGDFKKLVDAVDAAKVAVETTKTQYIDAKGVWELAVTLTKRFQKKLDYAQGQFKRSLNYGDKRIPIIQDELSTIEEMIELLETLVPVKCPETWVNAPQLYCAGSCTWDDDNLGCQQTDADIFCKLKTCNPDSTASNFTIGEALDKPGFPCARSGEGRLQGRWEEIVQLSFEIRYQSGSIKKNNGLGESIINVVCT